MDTLRRCLVALCCKSPEGSKLIWKECRVVDRVCQRLSKSVNVTCHVTSSKLQYSLQKWNPIRKLLISVIMNAMSKSAEASSLDELALTKSKVVIQEFQAAKINAMLFYELKPLHCSKFDSLIRCVDYAWDEQRFTKVARNMGRFWVGKMNFWVGSQFWARPLS